MSGKLGANSNGKQNGNFEWRNLIRFATMTNWAGRVEFQFDLRRQNRFWFA